MKNLIFAKLVLDSTINYRLTMHNVKSRLKIFLFPLLNIIILLELEWWFKVSLEKGGPQASKNNQLQETV